MADLPGRLSEPGRELHRDVTGAVAEHGRPIPGTPDPAKVGQQAMKQTYLPEEHVKYLGPLLEEAGFKLDPERRRIRYKVGDVNLLIPHHRVEVEMEDGGRDRGYVALLYFGDGLLGRGINAPQFEFRVRRFGLRNGAKGMIVFSDAVDIQDAFIACLSELVQDGRLRTASCISQDELDDLSKETPEERKRIIRQWMGAEKGILPKAVPESTLTVQDLKNSDERKSIEEEIVKIIVEMAAKHSTGATTWMKSCIMGTDWPVGSKVSRTGDAAILGDPYHDAENLVRFAIDQGTLINRDDDLAYMGSLLSCILMKFKPGKERTQTFERIIVKYNLIKNYKPTT